MKDRSLAKNRATLPEQAHNAVGLTPGTVWGMIKHS